MRSDDIGKSNKIARSPLQGSKEARMGTQSRGIRFISNVENGRRKMEERVMARYIDADKLCKGLKEMASVQYPDKQNTILGVVSTIENTPTADVVEVRHGEWVVLEEEIGLYSCSLCDYKIIRTECNYCPRCGAKMDGGNAE